MTNWNDKLVEWRGRYHCHVLSPVPKVLLDEAAKSLSLSPELVDFYSYCNGLTCEWFKIFPLSDVNDPKNTWDSINGANSSKSRYFAGDLGFFKRFLVFADISDGQCAAFDRKDWSIWYEEGELHQTDFNLEGFIETSLKEVMDL